MAPISEEKKAYNREYYRLNRERLCAASIAWYEANRETTKARRKAKRDANIEEARANARKYYRANMERMKERSRRSGAEHGRYKKYGITRAEYEEILKQQGGVCAICSRACDVAGSLSIDHDHETNRIRGLLCKRCNSGLGFFREDVAVIARAATYLKESK